MRVAEHRMRRALLWLGCLWAAQVAFAEPPAPPTGLRLYGIDTAGFVEAPRLKTDVAISVSGMLARVRVTQRFRNPGDAWVEGVYLFPLPDDAAVDHLRMHYADRVVEGEIREKAQARRDYAAARAQGKGASLVEQQRANVFTTAIANIPPHAEVRVEIEYQQPVTWQDDVFAFRYPMVVGLHYLPQPVDEDRSDAGLSDAALVSAAVVAGAGDDYNPLSLVVDLDAGLALDAVDSPYHRIAATRLSPGRYRVALADGELPADRDFVLRWRPAPAQRPQAALFTQRWSERDYSMLMLLSPRGDAVPMRVARELVLVVDTSGSMHGESIEQARQALRFALSTLRPGDRFNLIQFNDGVASLFERAQSADAQHVGMALAYVDGLRADGGTEMAPALRRALEGGGGSDGTLRQVVFLTDGAVSNEQALFELITQRIGDSRLFTVGIGSAPNALFMRHAARHGRGTFHYIGASGDVADVMGRLFTQLAAPVLTDIRLYWTLAGPGDVPVQTPERIGDLYAGEPLVVALRSEHRPLQLRVEGRFAGRPWQRTLDLDGAGADAPGVHALWARRRIDEHLAGFATGGSAEDIRRRVLDLALEHHLVSRFTSLVAVDHTPSRPDGAPLQRRPVASRLPAGWSDAAVFGRLPGTATTAPLALVLGLSGMTLAAWLRRRA